MQNISIEAAGDAHGITMTPSRCWKKSRDISSTATGI